MDQSTDTSTGWQRFTFALWHNRAWLAVYVVILVGLIVGLPGFGVIGAFVLSLIVALIARKQGSFRDIGLNLPENWPSTVLHGLFWGVLTGLGFLIVVDPSLEQLTGEAINLEQIDIRGKVVPYLFWLAIGWVVGGFVEEFIFRGTVMSRTIAAFSGTRTAVVAGLVISSTAFGLAHGYQGLAGQLSTGLTGLIIGLLWLKYDRNLWVPIFTHGFNNTVGLTLIYFDIDTIVKKLLFG